MHRIPGEIPHHKTKNIKLMAIVQRLQRIMVNENLTPDEAVGCAEIVRIITGGLTISVSQSCATTTQTIENAASRETCFQGWRG